MKTNNKKGFTLLELIVVMAVVGVLVLLAMPKFMGYTEKARTTKIKANIKTLEDASERYYIDKQDWPRASDTPYTSEELEAFAQKIKDKTGAVVTVDSAGSYYPIDYDKFQQYVQKPKDETQYVLQNPVGNVYYLDSLTSVGKAVLTSDKNSAQINQKPVAVITMSPDQNLTTVTNINWSSINSTDPDGDEIINAQWQVDDGTITTIAPTGSFISGSHVVKLMVQDAKGAWSQWTQKEFIVEEQNLVGTTLLYPEPGWIRFNDNSERFTYIGDWTNDTTYSPDGSRHFGTYNTTGQQVTFSFYGTKIRILGSASDATSRASDVSITIDGKTDTYSEILETRALSVEYQKTGLSLGIHNVTIKAGTSGPFRITLDAVDIDDTGYMVAQVGQVSKSPDPGWARIEDTDARITYSANGGWVTYNGPNSGGTETATNYNGTSITFKFYGTKIRLVQLGWTNRTYSAKVNIDGVNYPSYSLNMPPTQAYLSFEKTGLPLGVHTVTLTKGDSGYYDLDAVDIDDFGYLY